MSLQKNISGLAIAQIFSYIVPLLQFPYLSRIVGDSYLGAIIFVLSISQMAMVLTDYGFDLSIGEQIARGKKNNKWLSVFYCQVGVIKVFLLVIAFIFIISVIRLSKNDIPEQLIVGLMICVTLNAYNPYWIFQGLEKIYIYSALVIASRLIGLILIYVLIRTPEDYVYYSWVMAFQAGMTTVISQFIIVKWGVRIRRIKIKSIIKQFKYSFDFFLSRACVSLYSSGCSVFLATFGGSLNQVAIYGVAEQLYKAGVQVYSPVISALTPYMIRTKNYTVFYKILVVCLVVTATGICIGFLFGAQIITLIYGNGYQESKSVLDVFMIIIIASVFGMLFGYPALLPIGLSKVANYSVIASGILQIIMFCILYIGLFPITAISVCLTYLICDWLMFFIRLYNFMKYRKING
ncbi:oligosaccharide flippase family protein [Citrobacter braakii]|uniref:oligosaccharide flippase family protein n=1 Tax=Citrobacter braakii TaxID=57706 RepID=UPI002270F86B|nr:oligosaccharide flippase family protein [Citrobacter braakii]WAD31602.1 oligosaccharide flippase family protein [Citrobacter braakii]